MSARTVVAIHQPNFFPWLGFFDKIIRSDRFIVMDNAQFPKKGGTWSNRVKLLIQGRAAWVTMPIVRSYHGLRKYTEMEIDNSAPWRRKLLMTIKASYASAPFFSEAFPLVEDSINTKADNLADHNTEVIERFCHALGIPTTKFVRGSALDAEGSATALLISMVKSVEGTVYLCGGGADGYQDDDQFPANGIELMYQDFEHPTYEQHGTGEFVPGLSVVDAFMNCGFQGTRALLGLSGEVPQQSFGGEVSNG